MPALTETERSLVEQTLARPATTPRQREVRRVLSRVVDQQSLRLAIKKIVRADDTVDQMDT